MKNFIYCAVVAALFAIGVCPSLAADTTAIIAPTTITAGATAPSYTVPIEYGNIITSLLAIAQGVAGPALMGVLGLVSVRLSGPLGALLKSVLTEQMLNKALSFAFNTIAGAVQGKTYDFHTSSALVANALSYVMTHAPKWLLTYMGGEDGIRDRIIARIPTDENTSMAAHTTTAIVASAEPAAAALARRP